MAKKVTITGAPFDFRHSAVSVQSFTENGAFTLPDNVANYIVDNKLGDEGHHAGVKSRSRKGGPKRQKAKGSASKASTGSGSTESKTSGTGATKEQIAANAVGDAASAVSGADSAVAGADVSAADSASVRNG